MTLEARLELEKVKLENYLEDSNKGLPQNQLDRLQSLYGLLGTSNTNSSTISNVFSIASSIVSTIILSANNNRQTAIIINDSTSILHIILHNRDASLSDYSIVLAPIANNIPSFVIIKKDDYKGEIRGIWATANGFARVTEIT